MHRVTTSTFGAMCAFATNCTQTSASAFYTCPTSLVPFNWSPAQTNTKISITAYDILLVHQPTDMSLVQSSSSTTTSVAPVTTRPSRTHHGGTSTATHHHHHHHGTPTKVLVPAIVVPVVALFAIIAAIVLVLRARKRRARVSAYAGSDGSPRFDNEKSAATTSFISSVGDRAELSDHRGVDRAELSDHRWDAMKP